MLLGMSNKRSNEHGLIDTGHGWAEPPPPTRCPAGHLLAGNVNVGWTPCACSAEARGHRTYTCQTCKETISVPPCLDETKSAGHWPR